MSEHVTFALFDDSGDPLVGQAPSVAVYRKSDGSAALPVPSVTEIGGGHYKFVVDLADNGPVAYAVDCGLNSSVRYLTGSVGDLQAFAMYDVAGNLDDTRVPAFTSYTDGTSALPQPTIVDLSGGLYGFVPEPVPGKVVYYVVGDLADILCGSIDYTATAELEDPPAVTPVTIGTLLRQLSYGELSDLKAGVDGSGSIKVERRNQVVHFINEGLKDLHQRFALLRSTEEVTVPVSSSPLLVPLGSSIIQVMSVLTASGGSVTFLTYPVKGQVFVHDGNLSFPATGCEYKVQVTYQERHPELRPIQVDTDLEQPVYLVKEMWAALRAYVAGEAYGNMNTADAVAASVKYRRRYAELCYQAEAEGTMSQEMLGDQRFHTRGFV